MKIDSIKNGYVLDHIKAGNSMRIYNYLNLEQLECSVAILKNVKSSKMGRKDIMKIDSLIDLDFDVLGSTPASPSTSSKTTASSPNARCSFPKG